MSTAIYTDTLLTVEVIGFAGRALGRKYPHNLPIFATQAVLLIIAPAFFAATIYMVLGRLILLLRADHLSPIRPRWQTKIFVTGDVLSILIQASAASLLTEGKNPKLGKTVILIGLMIQIICFGLFLVITGIVHRRLLRNPTDVSVRLAVSPAGGWQRVVYVMYGVSATIFVRSIFRVIEFQGGEDGAIMKHEFWVYVFDSAPMFLVVLALAVCHPSQIVPSKRDIELMNQKGSETALVDNDRY